MNTFTEGVLHGNGDPLRYVEAGTGAVVVILRADGGALRDDLATTLAMTHRVVVVDMSDHRGGTLQQRATNLVSALASIGVTSFSVIGDSQAVSATLAQAVYTEEAVTHVIILSPPLAALQEVGLSDKLALIKAPTLVLVGTRDRSGAREAGRLCRAQIPVCHLLLVYEAGSNLLADRHEACVASMREFLEQGEGFIVTHESQLIRP